MSITSFSFLVFSGILVIAYFLIPHRLQWILLLIFSLYFYTRSGYPGLAFLVLTAAASFFTAKWMERENLRSKVEVSRAEDRDKKAAAREKSRKKKKRVFVLFCIVVFGIWGVSKYTSMVIDTLSPLFSEAGLSAAESFAGRLIVPLGISFYTFNCAGYVIDVSRKKYPAEKNFFRLLLFVSFFPHIIQGPFSRFDRLGKTLFERHSFDWDRMCGGLWRMLYGYCEKLLVADKLAPTVSAVMSDPGNASGAVLAFAVLGYGVQLYADFSGYMNIMCGLCRILGVELDENFRQPYFSVSIQNYWQRWHITLGRWYSDYIFYPASMGKTAQKIGRKARARFGARMGKLLPSYFAMIFVWTLTGLWHGARWTFVVWGWLNFAVIVFSMQASVLYDFLKKTFHINDKKLYWRIFQVIRTVILVSLLRIFYCSTSVAAAARYIQLMFSGSWSLAAHPWQLLLASWAENAASLKYILAGTCAIFAVDLVKENKWKIRIPMPVRMIFCGLLVCAVIIGSGAGNGSAGGFMYAQF